MIVLRSMRAWLLGSLVLVGTAGTAGAVCYTDAEAEAFRVRAMQTEFMVAALTCNQFGDPSVATRYGTFVRRFAPDLSKNAKTLMTHFSRHYGKGGQRELDAYVTRVANEAALRTRDIPNYCGVFNQSLDATMAPTAPKLEMVSATLGYGDDTMQRCTASKSTTTAKASTKK